MKDKKVYLQDIVDSIELIEKYIENISLEDFEKNYQLQDAVARRFEIIGEASKRLSDDFWLKNPQVPWNKIVGMRNFISHEYDSVKNDTVLKTCHEDLPALKKQIKEIIKNYQY